MNFLIAFKNFLIANKIIFLSASIIILIAVGMVTSFIAVRNIIYKPKAYSLVTLNNLAVPVLHSNDTVTGRTVPQSKVTILINPGKIKAEFKADDNGNWSYKVVGLKPGQYRLSALYTDLNKKLIDIKSFQFKVGSFGPEFNLEFIKKIKAQEPVTGPEYAKWVTQMQAIGIFPAQEYSDIVLYNRSQFEDKYCKPQGCVLNAPSSAEILHTVDTQDQEFLHDFYQKLLDNDYAPFESLVTYFPEIANTEAYKIHMERDQGQYIRSPYLNSLKQAIDQDSLAKFIQDVATQEGLIKNDPNLNTPLQAFITGTDGIFGLRSMINWATLPPDKVNDDERLNALIGVTIIYGMSEKVTAGGLKLASDLVMDLPTLLKDVQQFKASILANQPISMSAINERISGSWLKITGRTSVDWVKTAKQWQQEGAKLTLDILKSNYPGKNFKIFSTQGSSAVIWQDVDNPGIVYKVYRPNPLVSDPIHDRLYSERETKILTLLAENDLAPKLIDYIPNYLTPEQAASLKDPNFTNFVITNPTVANVQLPQTDKVANTPVIVMNLVNVDSQGFLKLAADPNNFRRQYETIAGILEKLKLWPGDVEVVVDKSLQIKFVDVGGFTPVNEVDSDSFINVKDIRTELINHFKAQVKGQGGNPDAIFIDLPVVYPRDVDVTNPDAGLDVTLTGVQGNPVPGGTVDVSTTLSKDGNLIDPDNYKTTVIIDPVNGLQSFRFIPAVLAQETQHTIDNENLPRSLSGITPLSGGQDCNNDCQVTLPVNLKPGKYKIKVLLSHKNSNDVIAGDSYEIEVKVPPVKITSIQLGDQLLTSDNLNQIISIHLNCSDSNPDCGIPVEITLSDGQVKRYGYKFHYNPTSTQQEKCQYNEDPQNCSNGGTRQCTGTIQNGTCKYNSSVDPACIETCNDQSPLPSPSANHIRCDDLYYYDPNVLSCIHKWAPNGDPCDQNYVFDHVSNSLCGLSDNQQ